MDPEVSPDVINVPSPRPRFPKFKFSPVVLLTLGMLIALPFLVNNAQVQQIIHSFAKENTTPAIPSLPNLNCQSLTITPDKKVYAPGETITISLKGTDEVTSTKFLLRGIYSRPYQG